MKCGAFPRVVHDARHYVLDDQMQSARLEIPIGRSCVDGSLARGAEVRQ